MQNKKVIIAIVLCIGAVISLIYGITSGPNRRRTVTSASERSTDKIAPTARHIIPIERHAAKTNFVSWDRNPFTQKKVIGPKELTLSGVIWDDKEPKALINNVVVGIGDEIEGNTVIDIKQDSVILNDGTEDFILKLGY